jgi:murein L,D-transpeptidase YcbB/YkuD
MTVQMVPEIPVSNGTSLAEAQPMMGRVPGIAAARRNVMLVVLLLAGAAGVATCARFQLGGKAEKARQMDAALREALSSPKRPAFVTADDEGTRLWKLTRQFYQRREFAPAWIANAAPGPQMDALIRALHEANQEGLDPQLYNISLLEQRRAEGSKGFLSPKGFDPREAGTMDAWLTYLYMKYASDLADGLSDLAHIDPTWKIDSEKFDPLATLEGALRDNRVAESLHDLTPDDPQYQALRKALADFREQAGRGGWLGVSSRMRVKPGQRSTDVPALAKRLAASGDFTGTPPPDGQPAVYGTDLQEALRRFERRHGLEDNAVVSAPVVAELNVPIENRIREIELNMERWRWLPHTLGDPHILINIPEYRLEVWDHGQVPLTMKVVVGKQDTPTPIFNDSMTHIVFSPYWNVPPDIAANETLPEVLKDPAFLQRTNMEVVDKSGNVVDPSTINLSNPAEYRFRQRPGGANSLGLVKFMFPNQYNVYLHDTPADSLFARASRSFSHGCVRVEEPTKLAEYLLRDQLEWTPEKIAEAMHAGEERTVKLTHPVPVYLGYWTARISADGLTQFRPDVYNIDARLTARLAERMDRLRRSTTAAATAVSRQPRARAAKRVRAR